MAFHSGQLYELKVCDSLSNLTIGGQRLQVVGNPAGASDDNDIRFVISDQVIGLECKNKGAFEGGGCKFVIKDGKLCIQKDGLLKTLVGNYIPYEGKIPSFMKGDKTSETWKIEKGLFHDLYVDVPSYSISDYYRLKGSSYIQVEGKGLYHTGIDILELGVPLFDVKTKLRVRTSKHINRKTGVPTDVTVALQYNRKLLKQSPICLVTRVEESKFQRISL